MNYFFNYTVASIVLHFCINEEIDILIASYKHACTHRVYVMWQEALSSGDWVQCLGSDWGLGVQVKYRTLLFWVMAMPDVQARDRSTSWFSTVWTCLHSTWVTQIFLNFQFNSYEFSWWTYQNHPILLKVNYTYRPSKTKNHNLTIQPIKKLGALHFLLNSPKYRPIACWSVSQL